VNKQPSSNDCFVCGRNNPRGLRMTFYDNGDDEVVSDYTIASEYQGYPGIVHGGVLAAILDEIVGRISLIEDFHQFMMSVRLDVKYRKPVPTDMPLHIVGRRESLKGRFGRARGMIYLANGTLATEASITLVQLLDHILTQSDVETLLGWRVDP